MRWYLNHDQRQLLGVPLSGEEKDGNLVMVGQLNLEKQIGRDTLADYKLFHSAGRTLEHSIGVKALARDEEDRRKVVKWLMREYSTLTNWGANPQTFLVGIKSGTADQLREAAEFIRKSFTILGYSDERLKNYDMELNLLLKSLNGGLVVSCPCCGHQFDYDAEPEHTFTQEVQDAAGDWLRWTAQSMARQEMEKLRPEIREQVASIIDALKGTTETITEKSITDSLAYVRCPNCWSRVYRANTILRPSTEIKEDKVESKEEVEKTKSDSTDSKTPSANFWASLNENLNK